MVIMAKDVNIDSADLIPSLDRLQERMEGGCYLAKQDGKWWLFGPDGEGLVCGETLRDVLINLVWLDC